MTAHNERRQPAKLARSCGCLPCRGKHCSLPDFAPLNRGPTLTTPHLHGRRGRRPLQHNPQGFSLPQTSAAAWGQAALHPTLPHSVGRAFARNSFTPPCRGRACPARNLPAACRQSSTTHHPIICARQPPSPQYTPCPNFTLKLCRKNQKNLQKPVDKGHTTCYNNQAVSRAQPAAAAAGAFTYSLYTVF